MLNFFDMNRIRRYCAEKFPFVHRILYRSALLVYVDSDVNDTLVSNETVLVLPPSCYWTLSANLKVKTEKEAAAYGAALFDLSDTYQYQAQKIGESSYILIAYDPDEIVNKVLSRPEFSEVLQITFAQWVFAEESSPIQLRNGKVLSILDGIVIETDSSYLCKKGTIELSEALQRPRYNIKTLSKESFAPAILTVKTLRMTLVILLILLGNFSAIALVDYQEAMGIRESIEGLLENSKLPKTSIEREAILSALKTKEIKQLHLRQICKETSDIPVDVKTFVPPQTPVPSASPSTSAEGIVLIPGSKPGEPNRLLVENTSSFATIAFRSEGIEELSYDGNSINLMIDTHDSNAGAKLKNEIVKRFTHAQVVEHNTQLEVRLK